MTTEKKPSLDLLKKYNQAFKQMPGSKKQKETIKQIDSLRKKEKIEEEVPTNNVGGGVIAGVGVGPQGEPGIKRFAGNRVFKVPTKNFVMAKMLKRKYQRFESYLGDDSITEEIREYANKNYGAGIVIEDEQTGAMTFLRYGKGK
jgi:hypothetical protein